MKTAEKYTLQSMPFETVETILTAMLPSGSGINCSWEITDTRKNWRCENAYHCMNDAGYYDGFAVFTVIIPKENILQFRLQFNGALAQYKNRRYMLRDYLEDTIYYSLAELIYIIENGYSIFKSAYIECLLWADSPEPGDVETTEADAWGAGDFSPAALADIAADCLTFWAKNYDYIKHRPKQAGHDFWLTRQGHGAGFWDPGRWPEYTGAILTKSSEKYGYVWPYVGDDGKLYF